MEVYKKKYLDIKDKIKVLYNLPDIKRHNKIVRSLNTLEIMLEDTLKGANYDFDNKSLQKFLDLTFSLLSQKTTKLIQDPRFNPQNLNEKTKDPFGLNAYAAELGRLREDEEDWKIYLDLDGVVADFDKRFTDLAGMSPSAFEAEYGKNKFWDFIDEGANKLKFWIGIPPMPQAKELIQYVSQFDYEVLTAPSAKKQSILGKNLWMKNMVKQGLFPSKPKVNFRKAKEKHKIKPNLTKKDILIDDRASTIDNWNNAGGTGILFTSTGQAINDLKKLDL